MNNKIKKLFAGIGLGMAGICLLSGCSANIDVSKDDVDKTLSNANAFFTSVDDTKQNLQNIDDAVNNTNDSLTDINDNLQNINDNLQNINDNLQLMNTKNGEDARQYLLSLLSNGIYDSIGKQEFSMTFTCQQYEYDVLENSASFSLSAYWEGDTYKTYFDGSESYGIILYQEVVRNVYNDTHAVTYTETLYRNDIDTGSKIYDTRENLDYFDYLTNEVPMNYYQLYTALYAETYSGTDVNYSMETIDGGLRFVINDVNSTDFKVYQEIMEFINGKLTKIIIIGYGRARSARVEAAYNDCPYYVYTFEFNDTVAPIEFDKTGYITR